ncbi:MAG: HNH endonuclease [Nitrospinae bacterium]|nr:HNH endonuclease [Nitrospinota bacterium]
MKNTKSKKDLFSIILSAIDAGGWKALIVEKNHPFFLKAIKRQGSEQDNLNLRIYIWNCTHGGGAARSKDEYRVQLTGVVPKDKEGETTLLLGWHDGYQVFAGFDITRHAGQSSASPSIQVKEHTLINAHQHSFSLYERSNGEIAVAFRPEYLIDYALNMAKFHGFKTGRPAEIELLNKVDDLKDDEIAAIKNKDRKEVITNIKRKYREYDFRNRVLSAYSHKCAMCGIQLKLIEAAHILPVSCKGSTDDTFNGVALCALHHLAYDNNLVSFDKKYRIRLSESRLQVLGKANLTGGIDAFTNNLLSAIHLPADRRDYPRPEIIEESNKLRAWEP